MLPSIEVEGSESLVEAWALVAKGDYCRAIQSLGRLVRKKKILQSKGFTDVSLFYACVLSGDDGIISLFTSLLCQAIQGWVESGGSLLKSVVFRKEARLNKEEFTPIDGDLMTFLEAVTTTARMDRLDPIAVYHAGHLLMSWWVDNRRLPGWHGSRNRVYRGSSIAH